MRKLRYLDLELRIERCADGFLAKVLHSPAGEVQGTFALPFSEDRLENLVLKLGFARGATRRIGSAEMDAARELGGKLFDAVFAGELRSCLRASLEAARGREDTGLRIRLRLQDAPELADVPWEYLYDRSQDRFLAQSVETPLVRYVEMPERIKPMATALPLRLLVVAVNAPGHAELDVDKELGLLGKALAPLVERGAVAITALRNATLAELLKRLRSETFHVFHFIGHGTFDPKTDEGVLLLVDDRGQALPVGAHRIGTLLHDHPSLRLAVLNSCEGGRSSRTDPLAGVATTLVRQGVPAVVAMQFEISDAAAVTFAGEFYSALADGFPVDAAVGEARKAVYLMPNDVEWGTPVLYLRSPDGVLFEWAAQAGGGGGGPGPGPEPSTRPKFVLVAGTGREPLPPKIAETSRRLGEWLARAGFGLVTGGWKGVDATAAEAFARTLQKLGRRTATRLVHVVEEGSNPAFPGGDVILARSEDDAWNASIERADAVVLVGGIGGTYETGTRARQRGKPVLPLADTADGWKHGDARRFHSHTRERWESDPVAGLTREDFVELASPAPEVAVWAIRCLEKILGRQEEAETPA
jgi:hypothetical protein